MATQILTTLAFTLTPGLFLLQSDLIAQFRPNRRMFRIVLDLCIPVPRLEVAINRYTRTRNLGLIRSIALAIHTLAVPFLVFTKPALLTTQTPVHTNARPAFLTRPPELLPPSTATATFHTHKFRNTMQTLGIFLATLPLGLDTY